MAAEQRKSLDGGLYDKALASFTEYLRGHNLKMTRERRLILKEIFNANTHLEAEDLLMRLRKRGEKVSRATIYRTFDLLVTARLIARSDFGHNHYHYEKKYGQEHHDHMICTSCGAIVEFHDDSLEEAQKRICAEHDFAMNSHSLQIFGVCAACRR